jgi:hypothetical protein
MENAGMSSESAVNILYEVISTEDLKALVVRYRDILFSAANVHNTTEKTVDYELQGLEETQPALKVTCKPDLDDWRSMLGKLFTTAREDEQLMDVIVKMMEIGGNNGSKALLLEQYGFSSFEEFKPALQELLDEASEHVDEIAEMLNGMELEVASGAKRLYAAKLSIPGGVGFGYESFGNAEDLRKDALVLYEEQAAVLALNTVKKTDTGVDGRLQISFPVQINVSYGSERQTDGAVNLNVRASGMGFAATLNASGAEENRQFKLECNLGDNGFEATVQKSVRAENLQLDTENRTVLKTEEEVKEAANEIMTAVGNTDFIAKIGEITGQ